MSHISPKTFYDDVYNQYEIKRALRRKRYKKAFESLYELFFNEHKPWITSLILQEALCIHDHSDSYQILSSLTILNLLEKRNHPTQRYKLFFPKNKKWWEKFKKEGKNDETG